MYPILRAALLALALSTLAAGPALAQAKAPAPQAAAAPANTTAKKDDQNGKKIPVAIEHDDSDPLGARLAYRIKEMLGRSSLMQPSSKDEKKIVIAIKTKEEFPGRPNVASIYSISWLFSSKEGSLKYFLTSEAGIVDAPGMDQTAEEILGKTDKLATTYGYLF
ncbi:hypothetical protein K9F62_02045 [Desulfovibrio sp. JY]|nr:hypothetical protein K9F62_02045 [Desulfovibrio sp. JY]